MINVKSIHFIELSKARYEFWCAVEKQNVCLERLLQLNND